MSCTALNSIVLADDCTLGNSGGIKKIQVKVFSDGFPADANAGITIEFAKDSANYVEDFKPDFSTGVSVNTITLTCTVPRRDLTKSQNIMILGQGQRPLAIVITDKNGLTWKMGYQNGAFLSNVGDGSGSKSADGSKYTLQFIAEEPTLMPAGY